MMTWSAVHFTPLADPQILRNRLPQRPIPSGIAVGEQLSRGSTHTSRSDLRPECNREFIDGRFGTKCRGCQMARLPLWAQRGGRSRYAALSHLAGVQG